MPNTTRETAPRTPPEGWIKTVITEYKPTGCPPPG